jgi:hypothetical protein
VPYGILDLEPPFPCPVEKLGLFPFSGRPGEFSIWPLHREELAMAEAELERFTSSKDPGYFDSMKNDPEVLKGRHRPWKLASGVAERL